jgi:hypothetical protein
MKRWKSAEFGAKRLSPEIQTKRHCRLIVRRSVTLIGTAPDAAKYSSARFLFGGFANMERPKLDLRLGPDAALIFMKGIGIPPRTKKSRVESGNGRLPCVHHR